MRRGKGKIEPGNRAVAGALSPGARGLSYLELSKPRLTLLVVLTTLVGFLLASPAQVNWALLAWTLIGTSLAAGGANALNQWWEAERDAKMHRTMTRPIPSGRLGGTAALIYALTTSFSGVASLALLVNLPTAFLALACILIYVLVYTPLKPRHPFSVLVGALSGAIPPMMGWTAATGSTGVGGWILAAVLFAWQVPHFLALAWLFRDDYERGGFKTLNHTDPRGRASSELIVIYSLALVPLALMLVFTGALGYLFALASVILGVSLLYTGVRLYLARTDGNARTVFVTSIIYMFFLLLFMVADRTAPAAARDVELGEPGIAAVETERNSRL